MQPGPWPEGRALMALVAAKSQIRISSGWRGGNWPLPAAAAALPTAPPPPRDVLCSWGVTPLQPGEPPPARGPSVCPSFPPSLFLFPCIPAQHLSLPAPAKHRGYPQHRPGRGTTVFPPPPPPPFTLLPPCPPGPENPKHVLHRPYLGRARERAGNLPARAAGEVAMGKEPAIGAVAPCSQKIRCPHVPWTGGGGGQHRSWLSSPGTPHQPFGSVAASLRTPGSGLFSFPAGIRIHPSPHPPSRRPLPLPLPPAICYLIHLLAATTATCHRVPAACPLPSPSPPVSPGAVGCQPEAGGYPGSAAGKA